MVEILSKEGEVTVLTQPNPDRKDKTGIVELSAKSSYSYMPKLKEYLNTHDFDLYISFGYGKYFTDYIGYWAKKHKKPSIVMPCGFFHTTQKSPAKVIYSTFMTKWALNNFSARVTATRWEKNFWNDRFGVTKSNSFVIPYNLEPDFTKFNETDILKKKKLKKKGYLLYIGRTGPNKLIQLLINAYNKTYKQLPLVIAGKGNPEFNFLPKTDVFLKTYTDEDIFKMKTNFNILSMGTISEDDKKTLVKNARLCIFPSSYESFGLSVVEPNALKVPVIASNIGPFKELLKDDSLLFENSETDLSKKIQESFTKTFLIPKISLPDEKENLYKVINTIIK
jgi:glycosyltransferase involved in cell wall biosynthesis